MSSSTASSSTPASISRPTAIEFIPKGRLICQRLVAEVLQNRFGSTDLIPAALLNLAVLAIASTNLQFLEAVTNQKQLAYFLTYANLTTYTGRFCLIFNTYLNQAILNQDINWLQIATNFSPHQVFVELYSNEGLTHAEKSAIEEIMTSEVTCTLHVIQDLMAQNELRLANSLVNYLISNGQTTCFDRCYVDLRDQANAEAFGYLDSWIRVTDNVPQTILREVYIFDLMTLIDILARSDDQANVINPYTQLAFSNNTSHFLQQKYQKEIQLYRFYLQYLKGR